MKRSLACLLLTLMSTCATLVNAGATPSNGHAAPAQALAQSLVHEFPYGHLYAPEGPSGNGMFVNKGVLQFDAPANFAYTGKMHAELKASYDLGGVSGNSAFTDISFDVLVPYCDFCGPFDAELVGTSRIGTMADDGSHLHFTSESSVASGQYKRVLIYYIVVGVLPAFTGHIQYESLSFTADMVALDIVPSPTPEPPTVLLFMAGLAVTAMAARRRRQRSFLNDIAM